MKEEKKEREEESTEKQKTRMPHLWEALVTFAAVIVLMATGIMYFKVDPHVPLFIGAMIAALMSMRLGYKWKNIEGFMMKGIGNAMQAIVILIIVGMLIGAWLVSGVVPAMIFYGLKLLSPKVFLVATLLICSITSLATGTSWGTMGTMGLALMGVAAGLGISPGMAAGAIISGAYFGDKMSPLSDTTNLAPAMAGTDVFTHVKFMIPSTCLAYGISLIGFAVMGIHAADNSASIGKVTAISNALKSCYNISPWLLIPPLVVILAMAFKMPAIPGISLGILAAAIIGPVTQGDASSLAAIMNAAVNGFEPGKSYGVIRDLLTAGGISGMMYSITLTMIAMMFGGIMESTGQLKVIIDKIMGRVHSDMGLLAVTELTCLFSNLTMPEQYISIVLPGRMYADTYRERGLHAKTLSNALESSGTVTSALIPWNTCGTFIFSVLAVHVSDYFPYALFNLSMPLATLLLGLFGVTFAMRDGSKYDRKKRKATNYGLNDAGSAAENTEA